MCKYFAYWFVLLFIAIASGALRDLAYGKYLSELRAHQLSTLIAMILLGAAIGFFIRYYPPVSKIQAIAIGMFWMLLTVAFEFLFFHFIAGYSWAALLANYNIQKGRLWPILLLWVAIAPYLFFRLRAIYNRY
ncbi:hypothetical protein [Buttiauxella gaviniae]|uniref:hypothetical protein n=1 Tax=Buttiauxella gaviniae TaxID=82990 RepID=UPI003BB798AD